MLGRGIAHCDGKAFFVNNALINETVIAKPLFTKNNIVFCDNIEILKESGFSEEDANCGIGQFKNEGFCQDFYQIADKQYCWRDSNGEFGITCAGLSEERKEELIKNAKDFDSFVSSLKEEIKRPKTKIKIRILSPKEFGF